jgi:hypothetical protein
MSNGKQSIVAKLAGRWDVWEKGVKVINISVRSEPHCEKEYIFAPGFSTILPDIQFISLSVSQAIYSSFAFLISSI